MIYIGVDLHLRFCYMTVLDASGTIQRHGRVANDGVSLRQYFAGLKSSSKKEEETAVAVEACGFWAAFVEQVEPLVERVVLVHPAKVKAIASAKLKNDRIDSATLAHLLRANLLPEAWKADRATRDLREVLRLRVALGQQRTRWKNQVHATLHRHGLRPPVTDLFGLAGRAWGRATGHDPRQPRWPRVRVRQGHRFGERRLQPVQRHDVSPVRVR